MSVSLWEYRQRYRIPPGPSGRPLDVSEVQVAIDNELARWAEAEPLRVCGRCESQTFYPYCPECTDDEGKPLELLEGALSNVVAEKRARGESAEDVFAEIEKLCPYKPVDEESVRWVPDEAARRAREKTERKLREALAKEQQSGA